MVQGANKTPPSQNPLQMRPDAGVRVPVALVSPAKEAGAPGPTARQAIVEQAGVKTQVPLLGPEGRRAKASKGTFPCPVPREGQMGREATDSPTECEHRG